MLSMFHVRTEFTQKEKNNEQNFRQLRYFRRMYSKPFRQDFYVLHLHLYEDQHSENCQ